MHKSTKAYVRARLCFTLAEADFVFMTRLDQSSASFESVSIALIYGVQVTISDDFEMPRKEIRFRNTLLDTCVVKITPEVFH